MVNYCVVPKCKNITNTRNANVVKANEYENLTWHRVPSDPVHRQIWAQVLNVENLAKSSRICSMHFEPDCFEKTGFANRRLKASSVPSLFLQIPLYSTNADADSSSSVENPLSKSRTTPALDQSNIENDVSQVSPNDETMEIVATPQTPKSTNVQKLRYPGDITNDNILKMSPRTIVKSMQLLKKSCDEKTARIKKLLRAQRGYKKKIESMEQLLADLRKASPISDNAHDVSEVKK